MPFVFVGSSALEATQEELTMDECLFAYFDDIHVVSPDPDRASHVYAICSNISIPTRGSESREARHRFGIAVGSEQRDATCGRGSHRQRIWKLEFGEGKEIPLVGDLQSVWFSYIARLQGRIVSCEWWSHSLLALMGLMVMFLSFGRLRWITATRVWQCERRCAVFER